jgi:GT2 family glycosyltransferase
MTEDKKYHFVVVTVLNYNGWKDATECVQSLLLNKYPNFKIVIVDNSSTDESFSELSKFVEDKNVELIQTNTNLGSVGGTNFGMQYALKIGANFVFTLSNDLVVSPDVIENLIDNMLSNSKIGVMSTKIMYYEKPDHIWSCGEAMNHWFARGANLVRSKKKPHNYNQLLDVDMLIGCAMFFRRELLEQIGMLDERYFYQNEEYEFFDRVRKAGWLVKVAMGTSILHKIGQTIGKESYDRWYYGTRNRLLYIKENLPLVKRITSKILFYGTRPVKFFEWLLKGRLDLIKATFEGWWDYKRGRLGKRIKKEYVN